MSTQGGLDIVTDGLVFQVDGANNLGDNVTNVKNIVTFRPRNIVNAPTLNCCQHVKTPT